MSVPPSQLRPGATVPPNYQRQLQRPATVPASDREKVLQFLKCTGHYRAHCAMLIDMTETEPYDGKKCREEPLSKIRESIAASFTTLTIPSAINYENMYRDFREWSKNSLVEFQLPLLLVAYPIMLHIYLLLICEHDEPKDALEFLRRHAWEHFPVRGEEIVTLLSTRPDRAGITLHATLNSLHVNQQPLVVSIPRIVHQIMMTHLVSTRNTLLLEILGRRVRFNILTDSAPIAVTNPAASMATGASATNATSTSGGLSTSITLGGNIDPTSLAVELSIPSQQVQGEMASLQELHIRWGLPSELWSSDHATKLERYRRGVVGGGAARSVSGVAGGAPTRYDAEPTDSLASMILATPQHERSSPASLRLQAQRCNALIKRVEVAPHKLPRVLQFSVAGGDEAVSMAMTDHGGHLVAVGLVNGPIRLTSLHSRVQALRRQHTGANARAVASKSSFPQSHPQSLHASLNPEGHTCYELVEEDGQVEPFTLVGEPSDWLLPADLIGHEGPVYSLGFSPDDRLLVSGGADGCVKLWSTSAKAPLLSVDAHRGAVTSTAWFNHGGYFASAGSDGVARMFAIDRVADGPLREFGIRSNAGAIRAVEVHPNSTMVLTSGADRLLRVWDIRAARCCRILSGQSSSAYSVAVSHAGRLVASGASDGSLGLWDLPTGKLLANVQAHRNSISSLDFSHGSLTVASGGIDGVVHLWDVTEASYGKMPPQLQGVGGAFGLGYNALSSGRPPMGRAATGGGSSNSGVMGGMVNGASMGGLGGYLNMNQQQQQQQQVNHNLLREDRGTLVPLLGNGGGLIAPGARIANVKFTGSNLLMVGSLSQV